MIRKKYILKSFSWLFIVLMLTTLVPQNAFALTGGPSQPEVQSFSPIGVSNMVDPATGDFSYNIPLMNIPGPNGGYPINLFYQSGNTNINETGSWVGLGWNLNIGAINRQLRGIPDDFNGEEVTKEMHLKKVLKANKKDHAGRRGLLQMVSRRRKLLDYLKRKDLEKYQEILERLSIRK